MKYSRIVIEDWDTKGWYEETSKNLVLKDMMKYPNNSIVHKEVYEKLLNNIDKIPVNELDNFLSNYNCL